METSIGRTQWHVASHTASTRLETLCKYAVSARCSSSENLRHKVYESTMMRCATLLQWISRHSRLSDEVANACFNYRPSQEQPCADGSRDPFRGLCAHHQADDDATSS